MAIDIHHVGQLLNTKFTAAVEFYQETVGLPLRGTTEGPVRVAFFELPSAEFHLIVREERGTPADDLLDAVGRRSAAHVAFEVDDLAAAVADASAAGLSFLGNPPEAGLGPYRRAFVAPAGHVGIPFEFVSPD
ncbi:VOC family protein [Halosegnis sp.]|uniref:VOC family protein n=1 Tax=Halosegnis sp. TaxID=2864959 RepID=UPI0035D41439